MPQTPSQNERPLIKMDPTRSQQQTERDAALQQTTATETGQTLANLMGTIIKEGTTGRAKGSRGHFDAGHA